MKFVPTFIFLVCVANTFGDQTVPELPEVPSFPVDTGKVDVDNDFSLRDPYFKQRAGSFYETEHLGFSARKLFELADIQNQKRPGTIDIIRGFIYEWIDYQVRGNGKITEDDH